MTAPRPSGDRLAVTYGYSLPEGTHPVEGERVTVEAGGERKVVAIEAGEIVALPRHGFDRGVPAQLVDHHSNIRALCELGCDRALALGSAGSLRRDLEVGSFLCPDDFYAPEIAPTFYDDPRGHSIPGFDSDWRHVVMELWRDRSEAELIDGGVYAQTIGPRFETAAEVRTLGRVADVVGMTLAAETVLAGEAGLSYAAVCSVDNLANGVAEQPLTVDQYRQGRDETANALARALEAVLPTLATRTPRR
jgi:5'-methylthioadenosine phosphorylase